MRIAIDCRFIGKSGIGTYIENILDIVLKDYSRNKYLLIVTPGTQIRCINANIKIIETDIPPFSFKELFFFPTKEINKCDLFYSPNYNVPLGIKIPIFITVHDVIFLDRRELTSYFGYLFRRTYLGIEIKRAKRIFTVSKFSKERIRYHFKCNNITITYSAISYKLKECDLNFLPTLNNYFVYVGNIKKHKGLEILLDAFQEAQNKGLNKKLIIVGEQNRFKTSNKDITHKFNSPNIVFTGHVDDKNLYRLIMNAGALILPSRYEGFGLPPLEALYLGTNIILSDIEALKEIYSDLPCIFFEDGNSHELCNIMLKFNNKAINLGDIRKRIDDMYNFKRITDCIISTIESISR